MVTEKKKYAIKIEAQNERVLKIHTKKENVCWEGGVKVAKLTRRLRQTIVSSQGRFGKLYFRYKSQRKADALI